MAALGHSAFYTRYSQVGIRNPQKENVDFVVTTLDKILKEYVSTKSNILP